MSAAFVHDALPGRVVFGPGRVAAVPEEARRLGGERVVVVGTSGEGRPAEAVGRTLGERLAGRIDRIAQHVPEAVADAGRARFAELGGDLLVAVGGGSAIGLAKAIALTTGAPILAVPTTYAGSEMTPIWGLTARGHKTTGRDLRVLPRTVVYDPALTTSLPPALSAASGLNALAHCAEALWVEAANPATSALAEEGIRVLAAGLPRVTASPDDLDGRGLALQGAWLAGAALAQVGTGLHHKLAHVLGGTFGLPHAEIHAALLPHTTADAVAGRPEVASRIARALDAAEAAGGVWDLARAVGAPADLAGLGFAAADVDGAAAQAVGDADPADVRRVLEAALAGGRP